MRLVEILENRKQALRVGEWQVYSASHLSTFTGSQRAVPTVREVPLRAGRPLFHSLEMSLVDSPMWCNVVKTDHGCIDMKAKKGEGKKTKVQNVSAVRASISFPPSVYETLETIAKEKKVSLAWVVREAAEKYIAEKWPLFARS